MLIVQKYGGTSVGDVERIKNVAKRAIAAKKAGHQVVVVVSAMSGETNRLLKLVNGITERPNEREQDVVIATGEQVTIGLVSIAIEALGTRARSFMGHQCRIVTDSTFSKARIKRIDAEGIFESLKKGEIAVIAGFQGVDEEGNTTTLGRGGSDTTAVAIAAAIKADACEIYTDVDGVLTADPRVVPSATKIEALSYDEMDAMARGGAKVLHRDAVAWARRANVALYSRSTFVPDSEGTLVRMNPPPRPTPVVAIAGRKDLIVVTSTTDSARVGAVETLLAEAPTAARFELGGAVQWVLSREDLHEAESLSAAIADAGATWSSPVGSVSVIGSGLGEDRDVYRRVLGAFRARGSSVRGTVLTGTVWTAFVAPADVDELVLELHRELIEG